MAFQERLYRNVARGIAEFKAASFTTSSEVILLGGEKARTTGVSYAKEHLLENATPLTVKAVETLATLPVERGIGTAGLIFAVNAAYEAGKNEPDRFRFYRSVYDFMHPAEAAQSNVDPDAMWGVMGKSLAKRAGRISAAVGAGAVGMQFSSTSEAIAGIIAVGGAFGVRRMIERRKNKQSRI